MAANIALPLVEPFLVQWVESVDLQNPPPCPHDELGRNADVRPVALCVT